MMPKRPKLNRHRLLELSLRPYPGMVFVTKDRKAFVRAAKELFDSDQSTLGNQAGRFLAGSTWYHPHTALVWWTSPSTLAHELSHVIFDRFETVGIDPMSGNHEPFCYMLSQLFMEAAKE